MIKRLALLVVAALAVLALVLFVTRASTPADQAERNRKFTEDMRNVTLVGHSTRDNREGRLFGPEQYFIDSVTHVSGDSWLLRTRLEHNGSQLPMPIPLKVQWAGDTPVITLTDLSIPGVGTYTARVVLYRGRYSGTWSGAQGGGELFGKIVTRPQ